MSYSFKNSENDDGNDLGGVAQHAGNFGVNVHHWKYINTNMSTFASGRRSRDEYPDEDRDDLADKDYSDPAPLSVPNDMPRPGRTFFVGLSYKF